MLLFCVLPWCHLNYLSPELYGLHFKSGRQAGSLSYQGLSLHHQFKKPILWEQRASPFTKLPPVTLTWYLFALKLPTVDHSSGTQRQILPRLHIHQRRKANTAMSQVHSVSTPITVEGAGDLLLAQTTHEEPLMFWGPRVLIQSKYSMFELRESCLQPC